MVKFKQEIAARKTLVDLNKAMRNRILKILAEPITNSDQVYKDMIAKNLDENPEEPKPIYIYVNEKGNEFSIVDYGMSMSKDELVDRFQQRGQEQVTHHKKSRSIFGQGISDLMFSRKHGGSINCIKDGLFNQANFKIQRTKSKQTGKDVIEPWVIITDGKIKADENIRKKYFIPNGNGTCVRFRFQEGSFPRKETLIKGLINMYMLRYINSNPKRNIQLIYIKPDGEVIGKPEPIVYGFREPEESDFLNRGQHPFSYEKWNLNIKTWVARWKAPLTQGEAQKDERDGGLLVIDENKNVYDLTLFKYDLHPSARYLHGLVVIEGLREVISAKLNDTHDPGEILTNTRDGFDTNHSFYRESLCPIMNEFLKPVIEKEESSEKITRTTLSRETREKQKKAFAILNDLDEQLNKEIVDLGDDTGDAGHDGSNKPTETQRPINGIEFSRKNVTLIVGKKYSIRLKIDARLIPLGSKIIIENSETTLNVSPMTLIVNEEETSPDGICSMPIIFQGNVKNIQAIVKASFEQRQAFVNIAVYEEEIYKPQKAIEFYPKSYKKPNGSHGKIWLYVDTNRVNPIGEIIFKIDKPDISLDFEKIEIPGKFNIYDGIIKIENGFRGHRDGAEATISAELQNQRDEAKITISGETGPGGAYTGWLYKEMPAQPFQTFYNPLDGKIQINAKFPYLQLYFGNDHLSAEEAIKNNIHAQTMLAELILDEALTKSVTDAYKNGKLIRRYPNDITTDIRWYIHEKKLEIAKDFHKYFVEFNQQKQKKKEK
jgi:hypothetical protein